MIATPTTPIGTSAVSIEAPLDETDGGDEYVLPEDDQEPDCWLIGVMHKVCTCERKVELTTCCSWYDESVSIVQFSSISKWPDAY